MSAVVRIRSRRQESSTKTSRTHGRRRSGTRVVNEVVTCGHTMGSATSRLWGSTRMRMVQLASSRSTTAGVRFLRRTQRRVVPSELTRMCLASPRRVGWVTAGKGQRRASSGADDGVTTRTKTFVLLPFDFLAAQNRAVKIFLYPSRSSSPRAPPSPIAKSSSQSTANSVLFLQIGGFLVHTLVVCIDFLAFFVRVFAVVSSSESGLENTRRLHLCRKRTFYLDAVPVNCLLAVDRSNADLFFVSTSGTLRSLFVRCQVLFAFREVLLCRLNRFSRPASSEITSVSRSRFYGDKVHKRRV